MLLGLGAVVSETAYWRRNGQSIVFTNGCFDLFHPGHLSLLQFARSQGDRLVVAVNSDASAKRLKGPDRPIWPCSIRCEMLSALRAVDLVVVFPEDTPLHIIEAIRPRVLVKGADYAEDDVIGADFVKGYGGRVAIAKLLPRWSTTGALRSV